MNYDALRQAVANEDYMALLLLGIEEHKRGNETQLKNCVRMAYKIMEENEQTRKIRNQTT